MRARYGLAGCRRSCSRRGRSAWARAAARPSSLEPREWRARRAPAPERATSHPGPGDLAVHVDDRVLHQGHREAHGAEGVRTGRDGRLDLGGRDRGGAAARATPRRGSGSTSGIRSTCSRRSPRWSTSAVASTAVTSTSRSCSRKAARPTRRPRSRTPRRLHQGHRGQQAVHRDLVDRRVRRPQCITDEHKTLLISGIATTSGVPEDRRRAGTSSWARRTRSRSSRRRCST